MATARKKGELVEEEIAKCRLAMGLEKTERTEVRKCLKCRGEFFTTMSIRTCNKCKNGEYAPATHTIRL